MEYTIWLTEKCNMNCKYCYENTNRDTKGLRRELDLKTADKIISFIICNDCERVVFHGGEPLLNFNILEYITHELVSVCPDVRLSLTTNGTIWDERIENYFKKYKRNYQYGLSVSLDGDEYVHNLNRIFCDKKGTFTTVINTIKELNYIIEGVRARITISPDTVEYLGESVSFILSLGVKTVSHAYDVYDARWDDKLINIAYEQTIEIIKAYSDEKNLYISLIDELRERKPLARCGLAYNIDVCGEIYPCIDSMGDREMVIGNVHIGIDKEKVERLKEIVCLDSQFCSECSNKKYCIGNRCKFFNKNYNGDWYKPIAAECAFERVKNEAAKYIVMR